MIGYSIIVLLLFTISFGYTALLPGNTADMTTANPFATSTRIDLYFRYQLFQKTDWVLYINRNGDITLGSARSTFDLTPFPSSSGVLRIAPYFTQFTSGHIAYRIDYYNDIPTNLKSEVQNAITAGGYTSFKMELCLHIRFTNMSTSAEPTKQNTFELVFAIRELSTPAYVIFNYIQLHSYDLVQAGFDGANGTNYFTAPGPGKTNVTELVSGSNINQNAQYTGRWLFRTDQATVVDPRNLPMATRIRLHPATLVDNQFTLFTCEMFDMYTPTINYQIILLFDGVVDQDLPVFNATGDRFTIHDSHLVGHLGQAMACQARGHFATTTRDKTGLPVNSSQIWLGLKPTSDDRIMVNEGVVTEVRFQSTVPVVCTSTQECALPFAVQITDPVLKLVTDKNGSGACRYNLESSDFNPGQGSLITQVGIKLTTLKEACIKPAKSINITIQASPEQVELNDLNGDTYTSIWQDYSVTLQVDVQFRTETKQGLCFANGLLHVTTFDGLLYRLNSIGQFVLMRVPSPSVFEIHIRTWLYTLTNGASVTAICAVAVRDKAETLILDMCDGSFKSIIRFASSTTDSLRTRLTTSQLKYYTISTTHGSFVNVQLNSWGLDVIVQYVRGQGSTLGLCGSWTGRVDDELVIDTNNPGVYDYVINPTEPFELGYFIDTTWRLSSGASIFERSPTFLETQSESLCSCLKDGSQQCSDQTVDSTSFDVYKFTNSTLQPFVMEQTTTDETERQISRIDQTTGDHVDYILYPDYNLTFTAQERNNDWRTVRWPTPLRGITQNEAATYCDVIRNSIDVATSTFQTKCAQFIQISESRDIAYCLVFELQHILKAAAMEVESANYFREDAGVTSESCDEIYLAVTSEINTICPGNCYGHGQCVSGDCVCDSGWIGIDCSVPNTHVLKIVSFLFGNICSITRNDCNTVTLKSVDVVPSEWLRCKVDVFYWIATTGINGKVSEYGVTSFVQGVSTNTYSITCDLPDPLTLMRQYQYPVVLYNISINQNGSTPESYSNPWHYYVVDDECVSCDNGDCKLRSDKCYIDGSCVDANAVNVNNSFCQVCLPGFSQFEWLSNPGNQKPDFHGPIQLCKLRDFGIITQLNATDPDGQQVEFYYKNPTAGVSLQPSGILSINKTVTTNLTIHIFILDSCRTATEVQLDLLNIQCSCTSPKSVCISTDMTGNGEYTCECPEGFTGSECETDIDDCAVHDCVHGDCIDDVASYVCSCNIGYTGEFCEQEIDPCLSEPCVHGECTGSSGIYSCSCRTGFEGTNCAENIDDCVSNSCQNGVCVDDINFYTCDCDVGWTGEECTEEIRDCNDSPCTHGTCLNLTDSLRYICYCDPGYEGNHCNINTDDCLELPCVHGVCIDEVDDFNCSCPIGYTGKLCEFNINECDPNPCLNGYCIDLVNFFECLCFPGYTGINCDIDIDDCIPEVNCNYGICLDQVGKYECICESGYSGVACEYNINDCPANACNAGTCIDVLNDYFCICEDAYTGDDCSQQISHCVEDMCGHGSCVNRLGGYACYCDTGYTGLHCHYNIDDCGTHDCLNEGICIDGINSYTCVCDEFHTGNRCETDIRLGVYSMWSEFSPCSVTCDYGIRMSSRHCLVPGSCDQETLDDIVICRATDCLRQDLQQENAAYVTTEGWSFEQIIKEKARFYSFVATSLNSYCSREFRLCCLMQDVTVSANVEFTMFSENNVEMIENSIQIIEHDTVQSQLTCSYRRQDLVATCGTSRLPRQRRQEDTAYVMPYVIQQALLSNAAQFSQAGLNISIENEIPFPTRETHVTSNGNSSTTSLVLAIAIPLSLVTLGVIAATFVVIICRKRKRTTPVRHKRHLEHAYYGSSLTPPTMSSDNPYFAIFTGADRWNKGRFDYSWFSRDNVYY